MKNYPILFFYSPSCLGGSTCSCSRFPPLDEPIPRLLFLPSNHDLAYSPGLTSPARLKACALEHNYIKAPAIFALPPFLLCFFAPSDHPLLHRFFSILSFRYPFLIHLSFFYFLQSSPSFYFPVHAYSSFSTIFPFFRYRRSMAPLRESPIPFTLREHLFLTAYPTCPLSEKYLLGVETAVW